MRPSAIKSTRAKESLRVWKKTWIPFGGDGSTCAIVRHIPTSGQSWQLLFFFPSGQHGMKNNSCQDCPLVGMCLTIAQVDPSPTNGIQVFFQTRRLSFALVDLIADGLIGAPPDHPPRILT